MTAARLCRQMVEQIHRPSVPERARWAQHPEPSAATHMAAVDALRVFDQVEVRPAPSSGADGPIRVAAFNIERGIRLGAVGDLLARVDADVVLLSEVDVGMARSEQKDVSGRVADRLAMTSVFAVEFVELGPGGPEEARMVGDVDNEAGLHGGAILSRLPIVEAAVVRLELDGVWFGSRPPGVPVEPRIGGRIAVIAVVDTADGELVVAAPHLESHGGPDGRARQLSDVLAAVDEVRPGCAAVVGGDLNTSTLGPEHFADEQRLLDALQDGADRFVRPRPWEPMFEAAERLGYTWAAGTGGVATGRVSMDLPPTLALDWFLTRGVSAAPLEVIAAVDEHGQPASDHELIVLDRVAIV